MRSRSAARAATPADANDGPGRRPIAGRESIDVTGISDGDLAPGARVEVRVVTETGATVFPAIVRLDSPVDLEYYRHGGILPRVLRQLMGEG